MTSRDTGSWGIQTGPFLGGQIRAHPYVYHIRGLEILLVQLARLDARPKDCDNNKAYDAEKAHPCPAECHLLKKVRVNAKRDKH